MPRSLYIEPSAGRAIACRGSFAFDPDSSGEADNEKQSTDQPFSLQDVRLSIRKGEPIEMTTQAAYSVGSLVCIVGRVGVGKSALLQGLLGELRQTSGQTRFSDAVSYGKP